MAQEERANTAAAARAPEVPDVLEVAPRLQALRARLQQAAENGFFVHDINLFDADPAVSAKPQPVPLGENCRLDRLLGGGLKPGTLSEILPARPGDRPAATGFLLGVAARFAVAKARGAVVWIFEDFAAREQGVAYGPGLAAQGLDPSRLVLVAAQNARQALWAMEEALKSKAAAVVIGELWSAKPYDLVASRRLLLAAQKQGTPGLLFLPRLAGGAALSSGADLRFEVRTAPSLRRASTGSLPLPGFSAFAVRIAKARIKARIKARAEPLGFDRERFHPLIFDPTEALFRDALSLAVAAVPADRPDRAAQQG